MLPTGSRMKTYRSPLFHLLPRTRNMPNAFSPFMLISAAASRTMAAKRSVESPGSGATVGSIEWLGLFAREMTEEKKKNAVRKISGVFFMSLRFSGGRTSGR
jgi:hypothetical protein